MIGLTTTISPPSTLGIGNRYVSLGSMGGGTQTDATRSDRPVRLGQGFLAVSIDVT